MNKADSVFHKKLNKTLIASGYKHESKNYTRFANMIYMSAQGFYDSSSNKLLPDYDLEKSVNPTGQNFSYSKGILEMIKTRPLGGKKKI